MENELIEKFKNREVKAKEVFIVERISINEAKKLIEKYHYLGKKKFMITYAYGIRLKEDKEYLGSAVFGQVGGISSLKGWFGLTNENTNILELTRLVMNPILNNTNATSFLLSHAIKDLKKYNIRAIVSLADSSLHYGYIYQACNFNYYGLSDKKTDFYSVDGKVNPRGSTKDKEGVWLPRSRKHRYCYIIDKSLKVLYKQESYPKGDDHISVDCCEGTKKVLDNRFDVWYTCPRCVGKLDKII